MRTYMCSESEKWDESCLVYLCIKSVHVSIYMCTANLESEAVEIVSSLLFCSYICKAGWVGMEWIGKSLLVYLRLCFPTYAL
jgi:hypothetical protein